MIDIEDLRRIELLQRVDDGVLRLALGLMSERRFEAGEAIVHQGEPANEVFLLFAGGVKVVQHDDEGNCHRITEFGPGALFGERALLTGEQRSADVTARSAVTVAEISRVDFTRLLRLHPRLYDNLCRILALQLGNWNLRHQREERENRKLLHNLVGWQILPEFDSFPGVSAWARELNRRLQALATSRSNVLILGERGTWKELAARLIHFHCGDQGRPILYLDCADPPPVLRRQDGQRKPGHDDLVMALAQESALFGHKPDNAVYASGTRRGFLELATGGELILENVEALAPGVQRRLAAYLHDYRFSRRGESEELHSRVRLIATSDEDVRQLARGGHFNADLCASLEAETVELLPLRRRTSDIPVIAKRLLLHLNQKHHKRLRGFSQEAINLLVDYDWPLNGQELQQVVDRGMAVASGPRLLAEHIFLNIVTANGEGRINLLQLPLLRRLFRLEGFPRQLAWLTVPLFGAIVAGCLAGGATAELANGLVWGLWWPALLVSILLTARSWCSYCPLSALARLVEFLRLQVRDEPRWMRHHGTWLGLGGLLVILLVERHYGLFQRPTATALLLLVLLGLTLVFSLVFGARNWCRHLCPLGRMVGFCSRTSLLELRSNNRICLSQCRLDDCIRTRECPMGLHPTAAGSSDDCILCGSCIRHCPHDAICLNLRYPWLGLGERPELSWPMALFAPAVLAVLLGPWSFVGWKPAAAGAVVAGLVLILRFKRQSEHFKASGVALLPLTVAALFALFFTQTLAYGPALLQPLFDRLIPGPELPVDLRILGVLPLTLCGGSLYVGWRVFRMRGGKLSARLVAAGALLISLAAVLL